MYKKGYRDRLVGNVGDGIRSHCLQNSCASFMIEMSIKSLGPRVFRIVALQGSVHRRVHLVHVGCSVNMQLICSSYAVNMQLMFLNVLGY